MAEAPGEARPRRRARPRKPLPTVAGPQTRLSIPTTTETAAQYKSRIGALLADPGTRVYIDTSFLMWATKIGPTSRRQALTWLRQALAGRVHVPTWAGHEYLRHHVAGTIVKDLSARSDEVSELAGKTFDYFRPFLDDPAVAFEEASDDLRSSTRNAVNMLGRLVAAAKRWRRSYPTHAEEVISFINEASLPVGDLYQRFGTISAEGAARYEGRVPPGFRDAGKTGTAEADAEPTHDADQQPLDGANRFGDLFFWKEVLAHASAEGVQVVVVLTNDRKNDWRMGGEASPDLDEAMIADRRSWRPVPRPHPMLTLEARSVGIADLALVDSKYLAAYLRDTDAEVASFADVAIVPASQPPPTERERREELVASRLARDAAATQGATPGSGGGTGTADRLFEDDPLVKTSTASLGVALLASRQEPEQRVRTLLDRMRAGAEGAEPVRDVLTSEALAGLDHRALATFARTLHDLAVAGEPGFEDTTTDLIGLLDELPPATVGAITLGLLASMYLEPGSGSSRLPPTSPAAQILLGRLTAEVSKAAVMAIRRRLLANDSAPLWIPDADEAPIPLAFDIEAHTMQHDELRSLKVDGLEILVAIQPDPALTLRHALADGPVTKSRLLRRAADLFALPLHRLDLEEDGAEYSLTDDIGFRSPATVSRSKEADDA